MELRPLHIGISVTDMDQAIAWYGKHLGFQLVKDDGFLPPLGARVCFLQQGDFQVELFQYQDPFLRVAATPTQTYRPWVRSTSPSACPTWMRSRRGSPPMG